MKKDEKLSKERGQPVFKGVMDYNDLDTAPSQEGDEKTHEDDPLDDDNQREIEHGFEPKDG